MRRLILTLLVAALVIPIAGAVAARPVAAQEMQCDSPMDTIQSLRDCVQHAYDMGLITNQGVAQALLARLDAAQSALDQGRTTASINVLQSFINTVNAQAGKTIDQEHAAHMVMHAGMVIAAIGG